MWLKPLGLLLVWNYLYQVVVCLTRCVRMILTFVGSSYFHSLLKTNVRQLFASIILSKDTDFTQWPPPMFTGGGESFCLVITKDKIVLYEIFGMGTFREVEFISEILISITWIILVVLKIFHIVYVWIIEFEMPMNLKDF